MIDRAAHHRVDLEFLAAALPRAAVVPVWRSRNYVTGDRPPRPIVLEGASAQRALSLGAAPIFLGLRGDTPMFAVDLSPVGDPRAEGFQEVFQDLRMAGAFMPPADAHLLGYARAMCRWHRVAKHCTACAGALQTAEGGFARVCDSCGAKSFPRTDPAVMILITRGDTCLLARQPGWPKGMFSALAGFVEPGESLEECVARESLEEVGMQVEDIAYFASQPWPFPHQLMVGFRCVVPAGARVVLDETELEESRWLTREALAAKEVTIPPPLSLAHSLIRSFIDE